MKMIIGLGNPGIRYRNTKHNMGFLAVDMFAKKNGIRFSKKKFNGLTGEGEISGHKLILFKPETYMNLSGRAVADLTKYTEDLKDIIVVYDDIDLELGTLRIRKEGSSGGHKGLKSVIDSLQTDKIPRLRLGIRIGESIDDAKSYVLTGFGKKYRGFVQDELAKACECLQVWISEGIDAAMYRFNIRGHSVLS